MTTPQVAALFVQVPGIYTELLGAEHCWGVERDARTYLASVEGGAPVVAHPPCHLWTNMARVNFKRYGGEHNRPGNDGGCFAAALAAVRANGGVLEHPAGSHAWRAHSLCPVLPSDPPGWILAKAVDGSQHWVCEVWQSAYGHKARKRTWLLYCGKPPFELRWERTPATHQIGWFDRKKPTLGKKEASATPRAFAEELIRLAEWSRGS